MTHVDVRVRHAPRGGAGADRPGALLGGAAAPRRRQHLRPRDAGLGRPTSNWIPARRAASRNGVHRPRGSAGGALRRAGTHLRAQGRPDRLAVQRVAGVLPRHRRRRGARLRSRPAGRRRHDPRVRALRRTTSSCTTTRISGTCPAFRSNWAAQGVQVHVASLQAAVVRRRRVRHRRRAPHPAPAARPMRHFSFTR